MPYFEPLTFFIKKPFILDLKKNSTFVIVSNDSIMKPPYDINSSILKFLTSISEKIGEVQSAHLQRPSPELRKKNRVKTIRASLEL